MLSIAVGVGHAICTAAGRHGEFRACAAGSCPESFQSRVAGVGRDATVTCACKLCRPGLLRPRAERPPVTIPTSGVTQVSCDDEHPLASVRGADVVSTHHERPAGVAFRFQSTAHDIRAASTERRHVLSNDPTGSHFAHEPQVLEPQSAAGAVEAGAFPCDADVLAGKATDDGVDVPAVLPNKSS